MLVWVQFHLAFISCIYTIIRQHRMINNFPVVNIWSYTFSRITSGTYDGGKKKKPFTHPPNRIFFLKYIKCAVLLYRGTYVYCAYILFVIIKMYDICKKNPRIISYSNAFKCRYSFKLPFLFNHRYFFLAFRSIKLKKNCVSWNKINVNRINHEQITI